MREIPLDRIAGTLEPARAELFDADFRPAASTRERWQRLWMAEQRGVVLPPISVTQVGDTYAVRDGHHACRSPAPAARRRSTRVSDRHYRCVAASFAPSARNAPPNTRRIHVRTCGREITCCRTDAAKRP